MSVSVDSRRDLIKILRINQFEFIVSDGVSLSVMRTRSQQAAAEKAPEVTVINKSKRIYFAKKKKTIPITLELIFVVHRFDIGWS